MSKINPLKYIAKMLPDRDLRRFLSNELLDIEKAINPTIDAVKNHLLTVPVTNGFVPTWNVGSFGNATVRSSYWAIGPMVYWLYDMQMGNTTTFGSLTQWQFSLPIDCTHPISTEQDIAGSALAFDASSSTHYVLVNRAKTNHVFFSHNASTVNVQSNSPFTWAVNDIIRWFAIYYSEAHL